MGWVAGGRGRSSLWGGGGSSPGGGGGAGAQEGGRGKGGREGGRHACNATATQPRSRTARRIGDM